MPLNGLCLRDSRTGQPNRSAGPDKAGGDPEALILTVHERGGVRVDAANDAALQAGIYPGQRLADARALVPDVQVHEADPDADRAALEAFADWCGCFTPWTAVAQGAQGPHDGGAQDGKDSIFLDVTGCTHLFGGEAELLAELLRRVRNFGFSARAAMAGSKGAAWALARYGQAECAIIPAGEEKQALGALPVAALRLAPETIEGLMVLGLRTIGDLYVTPRAPLTARFGKMLTQRLDQALGHAEEPLCPKLPPTDYMARASFAEPLALTETIARAITRMAGELCRILERDQRGARLLELTLYRVDGRVSRLHVGTSRPSRDAGHLARLFTERLDSLGGDFDAGYGFDILRLTGLRTERLEADQFFLTHLAAGEERVQESRQTADSLGILMDRLGNRLGLSAVGQLSPRESHIPERAVMVIPAAHAAFPPGGQEWRAEHAARTGRPLCMLPCPEPVEVIAAVPDGPPVRFRWRRVTYSVARSEGPERIAPEWWERSSQSNRVKSRDYYRVEDDEGRRFWIYRDGLYGRETAEPRWYMHGVFA